MRRMNAAEEAHASELFIFTVLVAHEPAHGCIRVVGHHAKFRTIRIGLPAIAMQIPEEIFRGAHAVAL